MKIQIRVCVVVLNWNQPALTGRCLDHLVALAGSRPDIVVVDNGSTAPNVAELVRVCAGRATLIRLANNRGFAGGMNVGVHHAIRCGYEFAWLLNNDAFPTADCLARLIQALEAEPHLACATPALFSPDGREQHAGGRFRRFPCSFDVLSATELARPVSGGFWLNGPALLFRVRALEAVGPFDPRFFAYWEEVDLFIRLATTGFSFLAVPSAHCLHEESSSTGGSQSSFSRYMLARNRLLVLRKHTPVWRLPFKMLVEIRESLDHLCNIAESDAGDREAGVYVTGVWHGLLGRFGRPRQSARGWVEEAVLRNRNRLAQIARRVERLTRRVFRF